MHPLTARGPAGAFEDVVRIAVLRGGGLGDLLFVLPAVDALARAYPEAEIVLLGTELHRALLTDAPGPVSRVEVLPPMPGVSGGDAPGDRDDLAAVRFRDRMRGERFDLACQLHGGGRHSNPFVRALGALHTVGTATADAVPLERTLPYVYHQHEILRWLETVALAGAPVVTLEPCIGLRASERAEAERFVEGHDGGVLVIHPGATDPRRRWPAERFAAIASEATRRGCRVLVVGSGADARLADEVARLARELPGCRTDEVVPLGGELGVRQLAALLARADVFVGNDSGPRHLAQAVGTATVGVYWVGNLINGGPLTRETNRVEASWTTRCPRCGADATGTAERCEHDDSFVADVETDTVDAHVRELMDGVRPR